MRYKPATGFWNFGRIAINWRIGNKIVNFGRLYAKLSGFSVAS
jgi:hypothetical protein